MFRGVTARKEALKKSLILPYLVTTQPIRTICSPSAAQTAEGLQMERL